MGGNVAYKFGRSARRLRKHLEYADHTSVIFGINQVLKRNIGSRKPVAVRRRYVRRGLYASVGRENRA